MAGITGVPTSLSVPADSYQFGKIVIDSVAYDKDLIILGDTVHPDWWLKQGHSLGVERFNKLTGQGVSVAAALHLTC